MLCIKKQERAERGLDRNLRKRDQNPRKRDSEQELLVEKPRNVSTDQRYLKHRNRYDYLISLWCIRLEKN